MKRDTIKTLIGLVIIGLIVVATFMYGNAQRQAQLKHDQSVKQQQDAKGGPGKPSTSSPSPQSSGTAHNTTPVQSPGANPLQGGGKPTPAPATPGRTTTPAAGPSAPLPNTGSPLPGVIGMAAIVFMVVALRRSKRAVFAAARTRR